jgi:AraC family transcriptional regulator
MEISAQAYLSPSYFSSVFRIFTGFTVKNYVNRYRLYRAAVELKNSDKRIVEITFINGFSSQQAFTRSFSQMYGVTPAQFRLLNPILDPFPPKNLWEEPIPIMELMECFENVRFIHKDSFLVAGLETDINYHTEGGTDPIGGLWKSWNDGNLTKLIPDQTTPGITLGITCNETAEDTGKYIVCTEVSNLNNLPVGLVGRRFNACDYAVFNTTLAIIWTGEFWRTFYAKWLPSSGYKLPDTALHQGYATFNQYPAIEVYNMNHKDEKSILQIYAPVVKI